MVMHTADGMVHLLADISGVGTAHEVVPVELQGDDVEMAFDCTYLLDVLGVLTGQTLRLEVSGTLTPCVIRSEADPGYRYIVMPMQIV
jgi:DNA polymerase-3 subunit beta